MLDIPPVLQENKVALLHLCPLFLLNYLLCTKSMTLVLKLELQTSQQQGCSVPLRAEKAEKHRKVVNFAPNQWFQVQIGNNRRVNLC